MGEYNLKIYVMVKIYLKNFIKSNYNTDKKKTLQNDMCKRLYI